MIRAPHWGRSALVALLAIVPLQSRGGPNTAPSLPDLDLSGPVAQLPPPGGGGGGGGAANQAPVITKFRATVGPDSRVTFFGTVTDDQPVAGLTVSIRGGPFGPLAITAIVDEDGNFNHTETVLGGMGTYTVTATVTDALGATSNQATTSFDM